MTHRDGFIGDGMAGDVEDVLSDDAFGESNFASAGAGTDEGDTQATASPAMARGSGAGVRSGDDQDAGPGSAGAGGPSGAVDPGGAVDG